MITFLKKNMAKNYKPVLLGYEDEPITEKHKSQTDYTVNKIGGKADLPPNFTALDPNPICNLCGLPGRLVIQIYAPLENSKYHRTLYLFACINSNCWNRGESWRCVRVQTEKHVSAVVEEMDPCASNLSTTDWCADADDWGEDDSNSNLVEGNCNISASHVGKMSDDEESSSFDDESLHSGLVSLCIDDKNANIEAQGGAVGCLHTPMATAEIERDEDEIITVETPTTPRTNLAALLHESVPLPRSTTGGPDTVPFAPYFMSVWQEEEDLSSTTVPDTDNHIQELLAEYKRKDAGFLSPEQRGQKIDKPGGGNVMNDMAAEEYEKSIPLHGDKMFHHFMTKIKANPEQILRYHREGSPLLLNPFQERSLNYCQYCQGELTFEFQLLPTIISKLRLECDPEQCVRLEFGTVLVFTCKKSCWSANDDVKDEIIVLQRENF